MLRVTVVHNAYSIQYILYDLNNTSKIVCFGKVEVVVRGTPCVLCSPARQMLKVLVFLASETAAAAAVAQLKGVGCVFRS